jgi:hypothetical protein
MKPKKDRLDRAMSGITKLRREAHLLRLGRSDDVRSSTRLREIETQLLRLEPVRKLWCKRQFFSGWRPGCGRDRPGVTASNET